MFPSNLKESQKGPEHSKFKGPYSNIKFRDKRSAPTEELTIWGSDDRYLFVVRATALWFNAKGWGIAYDLRHLQTFENDCPMQTRKSFMEIH